MPKGQFLFKCIMLKKEKEKEKDKKKEKVRVKERWSYVKAMPIQEKIERCITLISGNIYVGVKPSSAAPAFPEVMETLNLHNKKNERCVLSWRKRKILLGILNPGWFVTESPQSFLSPMKDLFQMSFRNASEPSLFLPHDFMCNASLQSKMGSQRCIFNHGNLSPALTVWNGKKTAVHQELMALKIGLKSTPRNEMRFKAHYPCKIAWIFKPYYVQDLTIQS